MKKMTPAVEQLVRLMVLLPEDAHPLWDSLVADCGDTGEVTAIRWYVGDAAKMWPPASPANLARAVLTTFAEAGDATLRLLSASLLSDSSTPTHASRSSRAGAAWVREASGIAIEVLAQDHSDEELLNEVRSKWSLRP